MSSTPKRQRIRSLSLSFRLSRSLTTDPLPTISSPSPAIPPIPTLPPLPSIRPLSRLDLEAKQSPATGTGVSGVGLGVGAVGLGKSAAMTESPSFSHLDFYPGQVAPGMRSTVSSVCGNTTTIQADQTKRRARRNTMATPTVTRPTLTPTPSPSPLSASHPPLPNPMPTLKRSGTETQKGRRSRAFSMSMSFSGSKGLPFPSASSPPPPVPSAPGEIENQIQNQNELRSISHHRRTTISQPLRPLSIPSLPAIPLFPQPQHSQVSTSEQAAGKAGIESARTRLARRKSSLKGMLRPRTSLGVVEGEKDMRGWRDEFDGRGGEEKGFGLWSSGLSVGAGVGMGLGIPVIRMPEPEDYLQRSSSFEGIRSRNISLPAGSGSSTFSGGINPPSIPFPTSQIQPEYKTEAQPESEKDLKEIIKERRSALFATLPLPPSPLHPGHNLLANELGSVPLSPKWGDIFSTLETDVPLPTSFSGLAITSPVGSVLLPAGKAETSRSPTLSSKRSMKFRKGLTLGFGGGESKPAGGAGDAPHYQKRQGSFENERNPYALTPTISSSNAFLESPLLGRSPGSRREVRENEKVEKEARDEESERRRRPSLRKSLSGLSLRSALKGGRRKAEEGIEEEYLRIAASPLLNPPTPTLPSTFNLVTSPTTPSAAFQAPVINPSESINTTTNSDGTVARKLYASPARAQRETGRWYGLGVGAVSGSEAGSVEVLGEGRSMSGGMREGERGSEVLMSESKGSLTSGSFYSEDATTAQHSVTSSASLTDPDTLAQSHGSAIAFSSTPKIMSTLHVDEPLFSAEPEFQDYQPINIPISSKSPVLSSYLSPKILLSPRPSLPSDFGDKAETRSFRSTRSRRTSIGSIKTNFSMAATITASQRLFSSFTPRARSRNSSATGAVGLGIASSEIFASTSASPLTAEFDRLQRDVELQALDIDEPMPLDKNEKILEWRSKVDKTEDIRKLDDMLQKHIDEEQERMTRLKDLVVYGCIPGGP